MEKRKPSSGRGFRRAKRDHQDLPGYRLRMREDHGGGLWTFESDDGQLYLAVKKRGWQPGDANYTDRKDVPHASIAELDERVRRLDRAS